eukprot:4161168-Amphidinium_carterae.1
METPHLEPEASTARNELKHSELMRRSQKCRHSISQSFSPHQQTDEEHPPKSEQGILRGRAETRVLP